MSLKNNRGDLDRFGFLAVLICLVLIIVMAFAMFTTQQAEPGNRRPEESYGPSGRFEQFQENVDKAVGRGLGDVL